MDRKLRMGMIGGGPGAFIGDVHRKASRMDGFIELVAGAFDIDPGKSKQMGKELRLDPERAYGSYQEMIEKELKRDDPVDFVAVATPNNWHFPIARDFMEAGFHIMCEKPMTMSLEEALEMAKVVKRTDRVFGLMHNYPGYPMVKLARDLVRQGELGKILKVVVKYAQGWLSRPIERDGQPQASWRTDPKQSGAGGCVGDIGTHAANLAEYITGLRITEVCAELTSFIKGRKLDDDANCLLHFEKGAKGVLMASQISLGEENGFAIWIYGENKSLVWRQEDPNYLHVKGLDCPAQVWCRGNAYVAQKSPAAARGTRIPFGHPEAFIEAFANTYLNFGATLECRLTNKKPDPLYLDFPNVQDGIRGMAFIETVVASSKKGQEWVKIPKI